MIIFIFNLLGWIITIIGIIFLLASIIDFSIISIIVSLLIMGVGVMLLSKATVAKANKIPQLLQKKGFLTFPQICSNLNIKSDSSFLKDFKESLNTLIKSGKVIKINSKEDEAVYTTQKALEIKERQFEKILTNKIILTLNELASALELDPKITASLLSSGKFYIQYKIFTMDNGNKVYALLDTVNHVKILLVNKIKHSLSVMGAADERQICLANNFNAFEQLVMPEALEYLRLNGKISVITFKDKPHLYKVNDKMGEFSNISTSKIEIQLD